MTDFAQAVLQAVVLLASGVVMALAEPAINRMSPCTPLIVRLAFHLLTVGAGANIGWVLLGDAPSVPEAIIVSGIALLLVCERVRPRRSGEDRRHPAV